MNFCDRLGATTGSAGFVPKGWGYEIIAANNSLYCGKILRFVSGRKCSAHYHKLKTESFFLLSGKLEIYYSDDLVELEKAVAKNRNIYDLMEKVTLSQGHTFFVPVGRVHQMVALEDSELMETSTTDDPADSYRIVKGD